MDNSLRALCDTIKKVLTQLKPQTNQLSFIILTGKNAQGKTALLKQSTMEEMPVFSEQQAKVYFNSKGIIVELGESWLTNSKTLLQTTFKQLNKCNRYLKITGLILCVDINSLLCSETATFNEQKKAHLQFLARIGSNLGYPIELAIIFTKMDTLAGFSEFYQMDHAAELSKPFGFSLDCANVQPKKLETYNEQFTHLIEQQGQQVIHKMHPARSTIKRSLIREFPLQLASLRLPIQALIQRIPPKLFHLHSLYFTSAEQGGVSIDRINKKIQHEYALTVPDTFPQATNFRSYFVEGALKNIQEQCSQVSQPRKFSQKPPIAIAATLAGISLLFLAQHYYKTSHLLDEASKELLAYDTLNAQGNSGPQALYHLSNAASKIDHISTNSISLPTVHQLKANLHSSTKNRLTGEFIPSLTNELEQVITNPSNTPIVRYKALKIYLMLGQPEHFSAYEIQNWFKNQWQQQKTSASRKQLALLAQTFSKPLHHVPIKTQVISDARNYLNALPTSYLYYSIAKEYFSTKKEKISVEGFSLATNELPVYFTKAGFAYTIKDLSNISHKLQAENWVLARQDLLQLPNMLTQAYCFDYVTWWQTFMRKSQPFHYQDYQQGRQIVHQLQESNALSKLITLIQQETKPDLAGNTSIFNQFIANKFTDLNLVSLSTTKELGLRITDLERFISTLSVINDDGKTAFNLTKARFNNENSADALSLLYAQANQLPQPLNNWVKQLAGDTWVILIKDSRIYINAQWQQTVFREFQNSIARRYPLDSTQSQEISIADFNHFFSTHGTLNNFTEQYIKPFLDVSNAQWKPKAINDYVMPISSETLDEIIRANIITNMFFPNYSDQSKIEFSLQKISLDPVVASLNLEIGSTTLTDNQGSESFVRFSWPQNNAKLSLNSIEGNHFELAEQGNWAIFKLLEKVNVLIDEQDSSSLQILFEVNSNSGRYLLKTNNQVNPFTPGILNGFTLNEALV
ncbi:type IVB secretion system protein IcmF [Legionella sp. km772]|uniref:type IVB secretion system protein IcmF n=1 Tax=Legionella sp. km772 TaxID=2498111 RepID=UPI000F8CD665|nr:type IVB secretion system protein IcmF [Legionella sp. km772]RUR06679.1 type VI secretion protein IcmF [Legionella sp. km772]